MNNTMLNNMLEAIVAIILAMVPADKIIDAILGRDDDEQNLIKEALGRKVSDDADDDKGKTEPYSGPAKISLDTVKETLTDLLEPLTDSTYRQAVMVAMLSTLIVDEELGAEAIEMVPEDAVFDWAAATDHSLLKGSPEDTVRQWLGDDTIEVGDLTSIAIEHDGDTVAQEVYNDKCDDLLETFFEPSDATNTWDHEELMSNMDTDDIKEFLKDNGCLDEMDLSEVREAAEEALSAAQTILNAVDEHC